MIVSSRFLSLLAAGLVAEFAVIYAVDQLPVGSAVVKQIIGAGALFGLLVPVLFVDLSKRARETAEAQIADAVHELALRQQALDHAVIFATTDVRGRITWANDMFCQISGYSRQELLGQDHRILKSGVHSKSYFRDMYRQIANGKTWRGEICNRAKDGSLYWVDTTIVPKLGKGDKPVGYLAIRIDISAQKAVERELRASELVARQKSFQMEAILANMSQGLCMYDAAQTIVVCNSQYAQMYGLSADDVKPGTALRHVIERRIANGLYVAEHDQGFTDERIASVTTVSQHIDELSDQRTILVSRQSMPGGGWVTMHQDITELQRNEARIIYLAHHDVLTGLANRSHFKDKMDEASAQLSVHGRPFSILMLDLDRFKPINDSLGHAAGDELLKEVAGRLQSAIRGSDILARLGGDEFAIIQMADPAAVKASPIVDMRTAAVELADRIIDLLNEPFALDLSRVYVGVSIGITVAPVDGTSPEDLMKKADLALYKSKANGRNGYSFFDPQMLVAADERQQLEADMRAGIGRDEFELHYQIMVDLKTRKVDGVEALVRWRHPKHGMMAPDRFIPLAEDTGLIIPLSNWVISRACRDAMGWPSDVKVAVNLSAVQFRKCNMLDVILCALVESGLPPERLEVEVTETVLIEKETDYLTLLHQLRKIGVSVALDDFGTGYSSLSYLKLFPFDKIKIDRSFTMDVTDQAESMAIVAAVIGLGRSLDIVTTAEGVETEEQFEIIKAAGVTLAQGYYFGRPCPNAQLDFSGDRYGQELTIGWADG